VLAEQLLDHGVGTFTGRRSNGCATTANKRMQVLSAISAQWLIHTHLTAVCRRICYERVSQERSPESFAINWIAAKLLLRESSVMVLPTRRALPDAVHNQYRTETSLKYASEQALQRRCWTRRVCVTVHPGDTHSPLRCCSSYSLLYTVSRASRQSARYHEDRLATLPACMVTATDANMVCTNSAEHFCYLLLIC